jgi:hypothetical protein
MFSAKFPKKNWKYSPTETLFDQFYIYHMFSAKFPTDAEEQGTEEETRNPPTVGQGKKNLAS